MPSPEWIADVNGYYRDLGVDPRATRREIVGAYQARGLNDAHLTYVVKQLLNPAIRRAYDRVPLGQVFLDEEVLARLRMALVRAVSEGRGTFTAASEVAPGTLVDKDSLSEQDAANAVSDWPWSYYLWDLDEADSARLRTWQATLVGLLGRAGVRRQIAVGMMGGVRPEVEVLTVGSRTVVFLHTQASSTDALARRAVSRLTPNAQRDPHNG